ncbi:MAG: hypothetical protein CNLJKLNK_00068 [Holosporales bacterium]
MLCSQHISAGVDLSQFTTAQWRSLKAKTAWMQAMVDAKSPTTPLQLTDQEVADALGSNATASNLSANTMAIAGNSIRRVQNANIHLDVTQDTAAINTANNRITADETAATTKMAVDTSRANNATLADEIADFKSLGEAIALKNDAQTQVTNLISAGASQADIDAAQRTVDNIQSRIATRLAKEKADVQAQIAAAKSTIATATTASQLNAISNEIISRYNSLTANEKTLLDVDSQITDLQSAITAKRAVLNLPPETTLPVVDAAYIVNLNATNVYSANGVTTFKLGDVSGSIDESTRKVTLTASGLTVVRDGNNVTFSLAQGANISSANMINVLRGMGVSTKASDGTVSVAGVEGSFTQDQLTTTASAYVVYIAASQNGGQAAEISATTFMSNLSAALTTPTGSGGSPNNGFSAVKKAMRANNRMADRMPNVFNALAENGPVVMDVQKFRFWLSPYASISNISDASEREKGFGALAGLTYRAAKFSVGFSFGYNTSKNEHNSLNKTAKTDGMSFGLNASANLWKDGVINFLYAYAPSTVKHEQQLGVLAAQSEKQKNHAHVVDVNVGHSFKLGEAYALDLSLGNTSVFSKQGTYFGNLSTINGQSQEVYAGFGAAWNKSAQSGKVFVRGSYQFGYQYKNSNKTPDIPLFGASNIVVQGTNVEKRKSHYVGLSTGMDLNKSWGFSFGYNGTYAKKYQNHTVSGKIEYRM